jgi:flavin reductase (DIM6/NTAB) family NADH-FMN oxidoreductase RutF
MSRLIDKILFNGKVPVQYPAISIPAGEVKEKVFLLISGETIDVTLQHCIVCQTPFIIAVWHPLPQVPDPEVKVVMQIRNQSGVVARMELIKNSMIEPDSGITLFEIRDAKNVALNFIQKSILRRKFNKKSNLTPLESEIYGALYAYPRGIILVSYKDENYYNIFPMDFQGYYSEKKLYILGLRITNITLQKILAQKKIVISDTDNAKLETIYNLGRHHSSVPPNIEDLGFDTIPSALFGFPVPAFARSYKELSIINNYRLGSHMMLVGKLLNHYQVAESTASIHHIHGYHSRISDYHEL